MSASYVARMTHTRFFTFSQAQRAPPRTCRLAPRSPLPSHHKHARVDTRDETSPTQHNSTAASWRVSPKTTHAHNPRNAHRTLTCRIQTHKPRTPTRRPAQHQPLAHCAAITACTPLRARHAQHGTQLRPPHTPPTENHTQSHTRPPRHTHVRAVRLPSVDGMLPESWLLYKYNTLQDTRTAIASHHGTRRRRRPQPAARNAPQRSAQHQSSQVE
jgi:hypothetical protein